MKEWWELKNELHINWSTRIIKFEYNIKLYSLCSTHQEAATQLCVGYQVSASYFVLFNDIYIWKLH